MSNKIPTKVDGDMSLRDIARKLGVPRRTLYRYRAPGEYDGVNTRYNLEVVRNWLETCPTMEKYRSGKRYHWGSIVQTPKPDESKQRSGEKPLVEIETKSVFERLVSQELDSARQKHPGAIVNFHHGYCVLLEETDELWGEIKMRGESRDKNKILEELVQVAVVARRIAEDLNLVWEEQQGQETNDVGSKVAEGQTTISNDSPDPVPQKPVDVHPVPIPRPLPTICDKTLQAQAGLDGLKSYAATSPVVCLTQADDGNEFAIGIGQLAKYFGCSSMELILCGAVPVSTTGKSLRGNKYLLSEVKADFAKRGIIPKKMRVYKPIAKNGERAALSLAECQIGIDDPINHGGKPNTKTTL